jgi:hypothetical protein
LLPARVDRGAEPPVERATGAEPFVERATGAELFEDGLAHAWPGDQILDDDPGAIPGVLSPIPEPEPRRAQGREDTGTERIRVRRPGRHLPLRGVGLHGPGRPSFVQRVGLDAVLVLLAVFGAVWMGRVDPPVVRQRVESSFRSVEQTFHSSHSSRSSHPSAALASGGSGFLNKLLPREPGDLALAPLN